MLNHIMSVEPIMKIKGYMTTQEAADYIGVTPGRIRQLVATNVLPHETVGNTNLIPVDAVKAYKENKPKAGWQKGKPRKP